MKRKTYLRILRCIILLSLMPVPVSWSQGTARIAALFKERNEVMETIASKSRPLVDVAKGGRINPSLLGENLNELVSLFARSRVLFRDNTADAPDIFIEGITTRANEKVWENWDRFEKRLKGQEEVAQALLLSVEARNVDEIRSLSRKILSECKSCHDTYRDQL